MAAISSIVTSALANTRMLWSNTATWQGGVVPGIIDDVTITGTKTTINQSAFSPWTGTITITVASTSGFPSTGFIYTYTNRGDHVKINYTGTTGTTFTGCSIDWTDPLTNWRYNTTNNQASNTTLLNLTSQIQNGASVYGPMPLITIPAGYYANVSTMIINNGGILNIEPGGNITSNNWITVRDGRFIGRANVGNVSTVTITRAEASGPGFLQTENNVMSVLDVDGGETRAYGTINTAMSIGTTNVAITPIQGSFAVGDEVAIYDTSYANTRVAITGYRDVENDWRLVRDEGFDVCGVSGNNVWLSRRNGARGKVLTSRTVGSQKILTVDKNDFLSQVQFKANDIVVINNTQYTITQIAESQYELAGYDFTTGSTLSDFLMDYTIHAAWAIDAYGAYVAGNTGSWHALVNKNIFRREAIVEAEMSPWSQWDFNAGTRNGDQYGLLFNYDPQFRSANSRNLNDGTQSGYITFKEIGTSGPYLQFNSKCASAGGDNWTNTNLNPTPTANVTYLLQRPNTQKIEVRNGIIKYFLNGEQFAERFDQSGGHRGLFGCLAWNNPHARIKTLKIYAPTQDLYITTTDSFAANSIVYEAGAEYTHTSGQRILKIASKVVSPGTHDDLAFAYRGAWNSGVWPNVPRFNTSSESSGLWPLLNHDFTGGYEISVNLSTTANSSQTIDLATSRTFTHIAWSPRTDDNGSRNMFYKQIKIEGSNDNSTWTTLYGPTDDIKRYCNSAYDTNFWYTQMGYYSVGGAQTYRYIRFSTNGHSGTSNATLNTHLKLGVFNFTSNNYTVQLNNTSDFVAGDTIAIFPHAAFGTWDDIHHYDCIKGTYTTAQNPDTLLWTSNTHSTIVSVDSANNILYLDRPINYGFIEGQSHHNGETVVKLNRNFIMQGFLQASTGKFQKPYFKINSGASLCQIRIAKNWQFYNVGSSRLSGSSFNRGVDFGQQDNYNPAIVDGVSVTGYNNTDASGFTLQNGHGIIRNCVVTNVRDFRPYYSASRQGTAVYNNKCSHLYRFRPESNQNRVTNYNEAAACRQWDVLNVADCDFFSSPVRLEFRRNYLHGINQVPAFMIGSGAIAESAGQPQLIEYNRCIGGHLNLFNNGPTNYMCWPKGMDLHAEHPGFRASNLRNEGYIGWFNTTYDATIPEYGLKDFLRAGYDYVGVNYDHFIRRDGLDYVRNYRPADDSSLMKFAFNIFVNADVAFQIYVEFEYRMPMLANRIGHATMVNSRLVLGAIQNGAQLSGYPVYVTLPTDDGWVKYSTTITGFSSISSMASVWLGQRSMQMFADFRNMRAFVKTDNPDNVAIISNTFDLNKYFNLSNDKKYRAPLSGTPNAMKSVKF